MTLLLLLLTGVVLGATFLVVAAIAVYRALRRLVSLGSIHFDFAPTSVGPGEAIAVRARVEGRGAPVRAKATLSCTMFDHRQRRIFFKQVAMDHVDGHPSEYSAELHVPAHALRSGVVGDELSSLFSEEAHRLLVVWTVGLEVYSRTGTLLARRSRALDLIGGEPLHTDKEFMKRLVVGTFAAIHDDLLFNYMVKLAVHDGRMAPEERELLHEVLRTAHGVTDPAAADARINEELNRKLQIDPALIREHVPRAQRLAFYKLLFALAWRDGTLEKQEYAFLSETLKRFGLDEHHVREIELSVLRENAERELASDDTSAAQASS